MLLIFHFMMKYYNRVDKESVEWKIVRLIWYPVAGVFFVSDIIYNWYSTLTFCDKFATWDETISYRMSRYIKQYKKKDNLTLLEKWRFFFAIKLCTFLGKSDPKHCGGL